MQRPTYGGRTYPPKLKVPPEGQATFSIRFHHATIFSSPESFPPFSRQSRCAPESFHLPSFSRQSRYAPESFHLPSFSRQSRCAPESFHRPSFSRQSGCAPESFSPPDPSIPYPATPPSATCLSPPSKTEVERPMRLSSFCYCPFFYCLLLFSALPFCIFVYMHF